MLVLYDILLKQTIVFSVSLLVTVHSSQKTFTCSMETIETLEQNVKLLKVNRKYTRTMFWSIFTVNFEHISYLHLVFLFLTFMYLGVCSDLFYFYKDSINNKANSHKVVSWPIDFEEMNWWEAATRGVLYENVSIEISQNL